MVAIKERHSFYADKWIPAFAGKSSFYNISYYIIFFLFIFFPLPVIAQIDLAGDQPIAIEASQQLEWLRNENKYRATGDVTITQGATTITGKTAEAQYDPKSGPSALTRILVSGDVTITSDGRTVTAQTATYDTQREIVEFRGETVTIAAPDLNVTAHDGIDYFARERKAVAKGTATVTQGGQTLKADTLTAWFGENNRLQRASARGHVLITRQGSKGAEVAQADRGEYDAMKNTAVLTGNVKITQGDNHMQGAVATVDMKTGAASLRNDGAGTGRVRAIFTPGGGSPLPSVTSSIPMIDAKKDLAPRAARGENQP